MGKNDTNESEGVRLPRVKVLSGNHHRHSDEVGSVNRRDVGVLVTSLGLANANAVNDVTGRLATESRKNQAQSSATSRPAP